MNYKLLAVLFNGSSKSIQKEKFTLRATLKRVADEKQCGDFIVLEIDPSWSLNKMRGIVQSAISFNTRLLIYARSFGACEMYRMLHKYPEILDACEKVRIVTLDPHSPWSPLHPFRRLVDSRDEIEGRPFSTSCSAVNIRQSVEWPTGAAVIGATNMDAHDIDDYVDHWNIAGNSYSISALKRAIDELVDNRRKTTVAR